ncbi:C-terminal binding protein [Croceicoccus bisphenolivorans]|uniref:C-terminal binding protein n=1 Tax=Croceicoccus bisphenolivorans TaxID=1783232 RepID=UPI00082F0F73|nr:C-terminal binding protein [Croceicoccus bisphenolivorans]
MALVLQTDYAWPDTSIERGVIEAAGHAFVAGPSVPAPAQEIEALVAKHRPDAIMTCWAEVSAAAIAAAPDLVMVQRIGVGLDNIAMEEATRRGVLVTNVPDYCVGEVADHAVALLLDWARGTVVFDRDVKAGNWNPAAARLRRVSDLSVGIVGFGRIGKATASRLLAFGCAVGTVDRGHETGINVRAVPFEQLLGESDVVIVHAPLTEQTHHLFDAQTIARMKPGACLINVSRGPLVDNDALLAALEAGHLSGAGIDVVEGEPEPPRALVDRPDVIVTPHIAFSSAASLAELRRRSAEEVVRVLAGLAPENPCNNART